MSMFDFERKSTFKTSQFNSYLNTTVSSDESGGNTDLSSTPIV